MIELCHRALAGLGIPVEWALSIVYSIHYIYIHKYGISVVFQGEGRNCSY